MPLLLSTPSNQRRRMPKPKKITVDITEPLYLEFRATVPWGLRKHLISALIRLVTDAVKKDGTIVAGAIMDGKFKLVRSDQ